ncbi:peptidylprolyl isomerase [Neisseria arctica]|uniref:Peptidyl-prolyl cis-trans isomerase n=1 Tax=Neisseria arctica TaxID=1470200 RepID=A0A0J0YUD8_9NEIS|nr:peptidylprolyl isomerase [Neisseria arctica]KLT73726.1 peptidylprolyl isomerase [Neisseria arctica]UOO85864.1 peptidyl-prolyl cis-trans isomerase [Neisseria arctica]
MNTTLKNILLGTLLGTAALNAQAQTRAVIDTNIGKIELLLDEQKAPKTVANFVNYAEKGFYDNTIFHRVIDGFMIQGGGFTPDMVQKATDKAISNEAANGLKNTVGTIAMARTANPNSATSQFFINVTDNNFLNYKNATPQGAGYAVFGRVTNGMDIVNNIAKTRTTSKGYHQNVPVTPIIIQKINIIR